MVKVTTYHRVSTEEQSLERQRNSTADYAVNTVGADLNNIHRHEDKSTGANTKRSGYIRMMNDVENGVVDVVVAHEVSRISRSIRDLDRTVERIVEDNECELHIIKENFVLKPGDNDPFAMAMLRMLGVFAELEAEMAQQRAREGLAVRQRDDEYVHGPAPLGFVKNDGHLVEAEHYDEVCAVLQDVMEDKLSKRKAAERLKTTRTTIRASIDNRPELYGIA